MGSRPYRAIAPFYDVVSGEWPVYGAGRAVGIRMLGARPGDRVLDLGCGTGLSLPGLVDAARPSGDGRAGRVIGVDRSPQMLHRARRRVRAHGWTGVDLVEADAADLRPERLGGEVDAVLAVYSLSVMADWRAGWAAIRRVLRPGGRVVIVDMQEPVGRAAVMAPLARLACSLGGADIRARPWTALLADGRDVETRLLRGGHLRATAGVLAGAA